MRLGIIRLQTQRLFKLRDRVLQPPRDLQPGDTQIVMGFHVIRL